MALRRSSQLMMTIAISVDNASIDRQAFATRIQAGDPSGERVIKFSRTPASCLKPRQ